MIQGILIFNNHGKPRLTRFYEFLPLDEQKKVLREIFQLVSSRSESVCNFLENVGVWKNAKIIYRHYATLYFVFVVDESESELGILDLIQVFVETLDRCFENVCELDLIFHSDRVHYVLDEIIMGGMVLETQSQEVLEAVEAMQKLERQSVQNVTKIGAGRR